MKINKQVYVAILSLLIAAFISVTTVSANNSFTDVPAGIWYEDAVNQLATNNILQGPGDGTFNPSGILDRAQAAEVLFKARDLPLASSAGFTDVLAGKWYFNAINAVTDVGYFEGTGDNKFSPNMKLDRAQAAKVLVEAYDLNGEADISSFPDVADIPTWANEGKDYFAIIVGNGVIEGKAVGNQSYLAPNDQITRAEFATMIVRAMGEQEAFIIEKVTAISTTSVDIDYLELAEAIEDATIIVKDSNDNVVDVVAQDLAANTTSAQFDFVTPVAQADLTGVWSINEIQYSFDELALVAQIVTESIPAVNQLVLFGLLEDANIENLDSDFIASYGHEINHATPTPVWAADIQAIIDAVNQAMADAAAEEGEVNAVVDATNQIQLLEALQNNNYKHVNPDWVANYSGTQVNLTGGATKLMLALEGPANYFEVVTTGTTKANIQAAIDLANTARIINLNTNADTAAKQTIVTGLVEAWIEDDVPPATTKADAIEISNIKVAVFNVQEATTKNSIYDALVALAAIDETNLPAAALNDKLKAEYLTAKNAHNFAHVTTAEVKTEVVTKADSAARIAAMTNIRTSYLALNGSDIPANRTAFKASLQKLADVTSHLSGANKFSMSSVHDASLVDYATAFATAAINSNSTVAHVTAAIAGVNATANEAAYLETIKNGTVTEVRDALIELALAATPNWATIDFTNHSSQAKVEVAQFIINNRNALADPLTVASVTNYDPVHPPNFNYQSNALQTAMADLKLQLSMFNSIGDLDDFGTTIQTIKQALDTYDYAAYVALSNPDKLAVSTHIKGLTKVVGGVATPLDFSGDDAVTTMKQANDIIDAAIAAQ